MNEIYSNTIFSGIFLVVLLLIVVHFLTKNRHHKDFYLIVTGCGFFGVLALYLFSTGVADIVSFKTNNFHTSEGICEIFFFEENNSARGGHPSYYTVHINGLNLKAAADEFPFLQEENIHCKATYLKATGTLVDIELNK
ncbi:hypothetical protein ACTL32_03575 [Planococcus sp. FY231025]|uniref:hypothetical protein n=1 Tax=Planococcus sp. FY231025 TaxID=3455699 RepID=UPI003F92C213